MPLLEKGSGLAFERGLLRRLQPRAHQSRRQGSSRLPTILKVTSGSTPEAADFIDSVYRTIITAGTYKASSIKVAEAAKVIENTQRDVNIALINELAMIFERVGIDTEEVLEAAGTKWNFLPFRPGPGRRPLHRRGPVLPDVQGAGVRLPPADDPRRPAHQRQHGRLRRRPASSSAMLGKRIQPVGARDPDPRPRVQGELPGPAQFQGRRTSSRELQTYGRRGRRPRPVGRTATKPSMNTASRWSKSRSRAPTTSSSSPSPTGSSKNWARRASARTASRAPCCTMSNTCCRRRNPTTACKNRIRRSGFSRDWCDELRNGSRLKPLLRMLFKTGRKI